MAVIKVEEVLTVEEFKAVFGPHGTLIQPTPKNKPGYVVAFILYHLPTQTNTVKLKQHIGGYYQNLHSHRTICSLLS
jgi:hypothetical protein